MDKYVLIVAGGKGLRMGGDLPKQFIPMRGKPLLMHTLEAFHRWDASARIILVLPEDHQPYWNMLCKEIGCKVPHAIVKGGDTRFFSVKNGLDWLLAEMRRKGEEDSGLSLVAVHDGVRPFVSPEVVEACFDKAAVTGAVIPVVPSSSRAYTPFLYVSTSAILPLSAIKATARSSVSFFEFTFAPR